MVGVHGSDFSLPLVVGGKSTLAKMSGFEKRLLRPATAPDRSGRISPDSKFSYNRFGSMEKVEFIRLMPNMDIDVVGVWAICGVSAPPFAELINDFDGFISPGVMFMYM